MTESDRIADLLLQWEESFEQGHELPVEELCRDRHDLIPALADRIAALKRMAWVNESLSLISISGQAEGKSAGDEQLGDSRLPKTLGEGGRRTVFLAGEQTEPIPCRIRLRGVSGRIEGRFWDFSSTARIGRSPTLEVVLDDDSVSAVHAELYPCNEQWMLSDVGSTNGTFLNDTKVGKAGTPIFEPHNIIRFGSVSVVLEMATWIPGDVILHRYDVEAMYEGGMGLVYRVSDRKLIGLQFAVKSPRPEYFQSEEDKQTFLQEAAMWTRIAGGRLRQHRNIVTCWFTKTLGGIPRIFAEYVEGRNLAEWIRSGKLCQGDTALSLKLTLFIASQIGLGLQKAHLCGVIHQDIKPSNIMIAEDLNVKITDFGLAQAKTRAVRKYEGGSDATVLATWGGMTLAYCSPEQAEIARLAQAGIPTNLWPKLTRRTDIWSWAVVVIEMLVGKRWQIGTEAAAGLLYLTGLENTLDQPHLKTLVLDLRTLLEHCLNVDPETRPKSMAEVLHALLHMCRQAGWEKWKIPTPIRVCCSFDGKCMVTGGWDGTVKKWDATTGQESPSFKGHTDGIERITVSQDGKRIVSLDEGGTVKVWDATTGQETLTLKGDTREIISVAISGDGQQIVSGGRDRAVKVWDATTGLPTATLQGHTHSVSSVACSLDGKRIVSGSWDSIRVWNASNGQETITIQGGRNYSASVGGLSFSGDGKRIISIDGVGQVKVQDVTTGQENITFMAYPMAGNVAFCPDSTHVISVAFSPDGKWLVSGNWDGTVKLWDITTGRESIAIEGHTSSVTGVAISGDGKRLISADGSGTVKVWNATTGQKIVALQTHTVG